MSDDTELQSFGPKRGQPLFALIFLGVALVLALAFPSEISWADGANLAAQPGFWPAVGVGGMVIFGGLHFLHLRNRKVRRPDLTEGQKWLRVLEFGLWFLAYVLVVPVIGYLPATLIFLPLLVWRMGYRSRFMLWLSVATGFGIVLLFKTLLDVKIPGGAIYEYLPGALRSFLILNF